MAELSAYEQDLIATVEKHGWQATYVFDPDEKDPTFSYSIGFPKTLDSPDFIIIGLDHEMMHAMLWQVFRQIKGGKIPEDGAKWDNILGGFSCISRLVHKDYNGSDYFNSARWFHKHNGGDVGGMRFMQFCWPDPQDGLFPWDEGCAEDLKHVQPLLFEPRQDNG